MSVKDPAYKWFAKKLCCGGKSRYGRSTVRKDRHVTAASVVGGRSSKCWVAVWKLRPRLSCGRFCRPKQPTAAVPADTPTPGFRRRQWCRRWLCSSYCCCCHCLNKMKKHTASISSDIGAFGIAPPTLPPASSMVNTFCGKLKRWLCCCCGSFALPKFIRRMCCCYCCCIGSSAVAAKSTHSSDKRRSTLFKCTGCCMVSSNPNTN